MNIFNLLGSTFVEIVKSKSLLREMLVSFYKNRGSLYLFDMISFIYSMDIESQDLRLYAC